MAEGPNELLELKHHTSIIKSTITPPSSKSESNRVLILEALTGKDCQLQNLSNARDTQTMIRLLKSSDYVLDVIDAGTTMRFLTAFCAVTGREAELTGTARMCERPIKLLVDALRELGASIEYKNKDGYPPLNIKSFDKKNVKTNQIRIKGDVSSQYITALLMIAPSLPNGLELELEGKIGSKPYIEMTLSLMKLFGAHSKWQGKHISVPHSEYKPFSYRVESDWSAASYWYSVVALSPDATVEITGYNKQSLQGDSVLVNIMDRLGVKSTFTSGGILLEKKYSEKTFEHDFTDCPDLAQTIAVICAAKGISCTMTGLESLRIKETDRIAALQNELRKFGSDLIEVETGHKFHVPAGGFQVNGQQIATYKDHRMAMAFAPLALLGPLKIEHPKVVEKSYPHFWDDFIKAGFSFDIKPL